MFRRKKIVWLLLLPVDHHDLRLFSQYDDQSNRNEQQYGGPHKQHNSHQYQFRNAHQYQFQHDAEQYEYRTYQFQCIAEQCRRSHGGEYRKSRRRRGHGGKIGSLGIFDRKPGIRDVSPVSVPIFPSVC